MVAFYLTVLLLSITMVEGQKGCWASTTSPGKACIQDEVFQGKISFDVRYTITSRYTRVCCEALACTDFRGCRLIDIGCGQGAMTSQRLPWELRDINPVVRCYATDQTNPDYYSFEIRAA